MLPLRKCGRIIVKADFRGLQPELVHAGIIALNSTKLKSNQSKSDHVIANHANMMSEPVSEFNSGVLKLFFIVVLLLSAFNVNAETQIFVENNSDYDLVITDVAVTGAKLSTKAWSRGDVDVPAGTRVSVLKFVRTGKFNWMDPTPRFVEPGKTVVFTTSVAALNVSDGASINLLQKLLGTGKSSKMWHGIAASADTLSEQAWQNDEQEINGEWSVAEETKIPWRFRAFAEENKTYIEYVFGADPD